MARTIGVGFALFLIVLVVRAPAGILIGMIPEDQPARLLEPRGTLWQGDARLVAVGRPVGRLEWSFRPVTLLQGAFGYDLDFAGPDISLTGEAGVRMGGVTARASGQVGAPFANQWLATYDIELSGVFELRDVNLTITGGRLGEAAGRLDWNGGPVTYALSGKVYRSALPAMEARLGPGPEAVAYASGVSTPLLHAALKANGFAKIGVTKYLTKILGNPWPGSDPDHAVVLEVEEQVF